MGLIDKINNFFKGTANTQEVYEDDYEKSRLADHIVELVNKINRINCFDGSIRGLQNLSSNQLKRKSMEELKYLYEKLSNTYEQLVNKRNNIQEDPSVEAMWTGEKRPNMTDHDLDFYQR